MLRLGLQVGDDELEGANFAVFLAQETLNMLLLLTNGVFAGEHFFLFCCDGSFMGFDRIEPRRGQGVNTIYETWYSHLLCL